MSRLAFGSFVTAAALLAAGSAQASPRLWSVSTDRDAIYARVALDPRLEPPEPSEVSLFALDRNLRVPARAVRRMADSGPLQLALVGSGRVRQAQGDVKRALAELDALAPHTRVFEYAAPSTGWDCMGERPPGPDYRDAGSLVNAVNRAVDELGHVPGRHVLFIVSDGDDRTPPPVLREALNRATARGFELALLALEPYYPLGESQLTTMAHASLTRQVSALATAPAAARALVRALNATYEVELPYDARLGLDGREHDFALRLFGDETNPVSATLFARRTPPSALAKAAADVTVGLLGLVPPVAVLLLVAWYARVRGRAARTAELAAEVLPPRRSPAASIIRVAGRVAALAAFVDVAWLAAHAANARAHIALLATVAIFWLLRRRRS